MPIKSIKRPNTNVFGLLYISNATSLRAGAHTGVVTEGNVCGAIRIPSKP